MGREGVGEGQVTGERGSEGGAEQGGQDDGWSYNILCLSVCLCIGQNSSTRLHCNCFDTWKVTPFRKEGGRKGNIILLYSSLNRVIFHMLKQ